MRRKAIKNVCNENCNQNCRTEKNYFKAAKLSIGGKGGYDVGTIQLLEDDRLVTIPVDVTTVFNEYQVNVTSSIWPNYRRHVSYDRLNSLCEVS